MRIVLLSGGSGKRLWPLSNEVRSKQFLKLFKNKNNYESMVQRVYRQIESNLDAPVLIATSKSQVSSIKNQLGDKVSVCIEPTRRDTFPAIALACSFLKYEQNVSDDEYVCVCPVDPYVDDSYFKTISKLETYAKKNNSNLVLMGINPSYPSDKYGYIIPKSQDEVSDVLEFKEKPTEEIAKTYIKQNAVWNAGVFCFKLKYLIDKSHELIKYKDYKDLFSKYSELTKISFDYAVVEKEKSIQVVRYSGSWKDVGSWDMMTNVMSDKNKGIVYTDDKCKDTNIINELEIPIVGLGLNNIIVVGSEDGILVSEKNSLQSLKSIVDKFDNEVRVAEKSWGTYQVIDVGTSSITIKACLKKGKHMSYHHHQNREETWNIISGKGEITVDGIKKEVIAGDVIQINSGCNHTIKAITDLEIIEVQVGKIDKLDKYKVEK